MVAQRVGVPSEAPETAAVTAKKPKQRRDLEEVIFKRAMYVILGYITIILLQFPEISDRLERRGYRAGIREFLIAVPMAVVSWVLFEFNRRVTIYRFESHLIRTSDPEGALSRTEYLNKCADYLSGAVHYAIDFALMTYEAWRVGLLPRVLGGNLDLGTEEAVAQRDFGMQTKVIFMYAYGHHIERLITHWITKRHSPTYHSMLTHHIITAAVMAMAYHMRYLMFGIPVIVLFDLSDGLLQLSRFLRETNFRKATELTFLSMVVSWFAMRIVGFFWEIILAVIATMKRGEHEFFMAFPVSHFFFFVALVLLCVLNVFWFYQIMKIVITNVIMKKTKIDYEDRQGTEESG